MSVVALGIIAASTLFLLIGLIRPGWVGRSGRGGVVAWTIAGWFLAIGLAVGTIGYTHSHPNGPHAFEGYLKDYIADECAKGADLPGCKALNDAGKASETK